MDMFNKDKSGKYKQALRLMNSGSTPEERTANRAKARKMFTDMAADKTYSESESKVLRRMGDENDPMRAALDRTVGHMGAVSQAQARFGTSEMITRRMKRLQGAMGEDQERILEGLNAISMDKGGKKGGLGEHIRGMMSRNVTSPEEMAKDIKDITRAAMEGDEETVARAAAELKDVPGGEAIYTAMKAGWETKQAARKLVGTKRFEAIGAARALMLGLGTDISKEELKALQKDASGATRDKILGRIQDEDQRKSARALLEGIKDNKLEKVLEGGLKSARVRAVAQSGDPDKGLQNQLKSGIKPGDWAGALGSPKGMHAELVQIRDTLKIISKSKGITGKDGGTDNPQEGEG